MKLKELAANMEVGGLFAEGYDGKGNKVSITYDINDVAKLTIRSNESNGNIAIGKDLNEAEHMT